MKKKHGFRRVKALTSCCGECGEKREKRFLYIFVRKVIKTSSEINQWAELQWKVNFQWKALKLMQDVSSLQKKKSS